jgi:hypothetical protein
MSKIVFLHYRSIDYTRGDVAARGGATVAIEQTDKGEIRTAVAWCSNKDNYNKRVGRALAGGRLMYGKMFTEQTELTNIGETVNHVDDFMALNYGYFRTTKKKRTYSV